MCGKREKKRLLYAETCFALKKRQKLCFFEFADFYKCACIIYINTRSVKYKFYLQLKKYLKHNLFYRAFADKRRMRVFGEKHHKFARA